MAAVPRPPQGLPLPPGEVARRAGEGEEGFALRSEFLFKRLKRNQKIARGYNAARDRQSRLLAHVIPRPPLEVGGIAAFGRRKICRRGGYAPPWAKICFVLRELHDPPATVGGKDCRRQHPRQVARRCRKRGQF